MNGAKETRTPDPLHAMQVLYQLIWFCTLENPRHHLICLDGLSRVMGLLGPVFAKMRPKMRPAVCPVLRPTWRSDG